MAEYAGSATVTQWIWSGGTLTLTAEERKVDVSPTVERYDSTAGPSANKERIVGVGDCTITWDGVAQDGTTAGTLAGTAYATALKAGNIGTVIVAPYGTATNSLKYTLPAICLGAQVALPYADVAELSVTWEGNTSAGLTTGNY